MKSISENTNIYYIVYQILTSTKTHTHVSKMKKMLYDD